MVFFQSCKALAEYRKGRFGSAAEWALKALSQREYATGYTLRDDCRRVGANLVLAMSKYQLHSPDEARASLARGSHTADEKLPKLELVGLGQACWRRQRMKAVVGANLLETTEGFLPLLGEALSNHGV